MEKILSERGKPLLLLNGFKYRYLRKIVSTKEEHWRCTRKNCTARIHTLEDGTISSKLVDIHNHEPVPKNVLIRQRINNCFKRKAIDNIDQTPAKLIRSEIGDFKNAKDILTRQDMKYISNNITRYRLQARSTIEVIPEQNPPTTVFPSTDGSPQTTSRPTVNYDVNNYEIPEEDQAEVGPELESLTQEDDDSNLPLPSHFLFLDEKADNSQSETYQPCDDSAMQDSSMLDHESTVSHSPNRGEENTPSMVYRESCQSVIDGSKDTERDDLLELPASVKRILDRPAGVMKESLELFGKYITSILKELPISKAYKLQKKFLDEAIYARVNYESQHPSDPPSESLEPLTNDSQPLQNTNPVDMPEDTASTSPNSTTNNSKKRSATAEDSLEVLFEEPAAVVMPSTPTSWQGSRQGSRHRSRSSQKKSSGEVPSRSPSPCRRQGIPNIDPQNLLETVTQLSQAVAIIAQMQEQCMPSPAWPLATQPVPVTGDANFQYDRLLPIQPTPFPPVTESQVQHTAAALHAKLPSLKGRDAHESMYLLSVMAFYPELPEQLKQITYQRMNVLFIATHYGWGAAIAASAADSPAASPQGFNLTQYTRPAYRGRGRQPPRHRNQQQRWGWSRNRSQETHSDISSNLPQETALKSTTSSTVRKRKKMEPKTEHPLSEPLELPEFVAIKQEQEYISTAEKQIEMCKDRSYIEIEEEVKPKLEVVHGENIYNQNSV